MSGVFAIAMGVLLGEVLYSFVGAVLKVILSRLEKMEDGE